MKGSALNITVYNFLNFVTYKIFIEYTFLWYELFGMNSLTAMQIMFLHGSKRNASHWFGAVASGSDFHLRMFSQHAHEPQHSAVANECIAVQSKPVKAGHTTEGAWRYTLQ